MVYQWLHWCERPFRLTEQKELIAFVKAIQCKSIWFEFSLIRWQELSCRLFCVFAENVRCRLSAQLKSVGFFFVFKGYCVFDTPRSVFWCVRHIAFVMFCQTLPQISGMTDVALIRMSNTADNVSVKHGVSPVLCRTALRRKSFLLRWNYGGLLWRASFARFVYDFAYFCKQKKSTDSRMTCNNSQRFALLRVKLRRASFARSVSLRLFLQAKKIYVWHSWRPAIRSFSEGWWAMTDSNRRHFACKANALTNWANRPD